MNRPLVIMAIGAVVVISAIAANFFLWRQEVSEPPVAEQSSEPSEALKKAVDAAAKAADKAERAADRALAARQAAERAAAAAQAPGASDNSAEEADEAERKAAEAELEARRAAAAAEAARAVARATSQPTETPVSSGGTSSSQDGPAAVSAPQETSSPSQSSQASESPLAAGADRTAAVSPDDVPTSQGDPSPELSAQTMEAAARAEEQAERAADRASAAREAADKALAAAGAPGATDNAARQAAEAESRAVEAEIEAQRAAASAEAARAVADATSASAPEPGRQTSQPSRPDTPAQAAVAALPSERSVSTPGTTPDTRSKPRFDVVRISPSGDAVMAGRARPGDSVRVLDRGEVIGEVTADARGEWVFVPGAPLPPGTSELTLETPQGEGDPIMSESAVVLVVPEPGQDIAGRPAEPTSQPLALMVPRSRPEIISVPENRMASVVLQGPNAEGASVPLSIDIIDYDDAGRLSISGRAPRPSIVQLYLDNRFVGRSTTNQAGIWVHSPKDHVEPGLYTLRADQVNESGNVLARVSIPFTRAEPLAPGQGRYVIVQPGNSLWRIARQAYGTGFQYTVIYEANTQQIADPDLIFPGQIFALPSVN